VEVFGDFLLVGVWEVFEALEIAERLSEGWVGDDALDPGTRNNEAVAHLLGR
jgi:hypothetical protein